MKVKTESMKLVCDGCGETFETGEGYVCYADDPDGSLLWSDASASDWLQMGDRHYCPDCWERDDDDNILTKDGRKYNDDHELIEQPVNPDEVQDGDILVGGECIFIYKGIDSERKYGGTDKAIIYYACHNTHDGYVSIGPKIGVGSFDGSINAGIRHRKAYTDERDLLFAKLKEKGYRWAGREKGLINEDEK
jgi:hypothetical protein